jgi:hypothetical protein
VSYDTCGLILNALCSYHRWMFVFLEAISVQVLFSLLLRQNMQLNLKNRFSVISYRWNALAYGAGPSTSTWNYWWCHQYFSCSGFTLLYAIDIYACMQVFCVRRSPKNSVFSLIYVMHYFQWTSFNSYSASCSYLLMFHLFELFQLRLACVFLVFFDEHVFY